MTSVVCFKDVKQSALYFDRILPVSFRRMQGMGTDIVFEFPERILNRHQFSRHFPAVLGDAFHTLPVTAFH